MAKKIFNYTPTMIIVSLLALMVVYVIMVYPEERVRLFDQGEDTGQVSVIIEDLSFVPETMETRVGGKIVWKNQDITKHTVSFAEFGSGVLDPGESYSHTFTETGTYQYSCEFHPSMTGIVIVK